MRPSLLLRTCAWNLPLLLLALTIPAVALGQPSRSPDLTPGVREHLSQAAADTLLPLWQREFMLRAAHGSSVGTADFAAPDDRAVVSVPGAADGAQAVQAGPASARDAHTAIYDPVRDRMVVFGGWQSGTNFNDVWALSLSGTPAWTELAPSGTPPSVRRFHSAIYDPVRDRMVVFGGFTGDVYLNDVWALSLAGTPAWTELTPSGTPPTQRYRQSAIYDPVRDRMVMFGGWMSGTNFNDVWALSLAGTPAWTELAPSGTPPSARYSHSAIYDPLRDRMVVFGGVEDGFFNDVWALSLAGTPAWSELAPGGSPPTARYVHSAIYDPAHDRMVVFGGYDGSNYRHDAWALSLAGTPAWTVLTPGGTLPGGRYGHSAILDPARGRMVVFGGFADSGFFSDVWGLALDGSAWTQISAPDLHTLTVNATHGTVSEVPLPSGGKYVFGTAVLLTATPEAGYHFVDYTGDVTAATDTVTVVMTGDKTVTANFSADSVTLTVNATHGTVSEAPLPSGGKYVHGTAVLLTATPEVGFHFVDYTGDVTAATDTVTVVMTGDKTVTANFSADSVTLTVNATHGTVGEAPLPSGGKYLHGTAVLLTATPEAGYHFVDYTGDVTAATDTVTVVMTGDKTVTANFSADSVTLTVNATHGTVGEAPLPSGGKYLHGTAVLLTAAPEAGYHFVDYTGDVTAATDTVTVVMTGDKTVTANFSADSVTLTVIATNGLVSEAPPPSGKYLYGTAVLLTATPEAGFHFVDYTGDVTAATDTVTVVMTGDKTVTANFQPTTGVAGKARPTVTLLRPAMPNPFRRSATLAFSIARGGPVDLAVYSVDGRRVRTLVRESREPGEYRATWDGCDDGGSPISAGVYYARLETLDRPLTRILTYLK